MWIWHSLKCFYHTSHRRHHMWSETWCRANDPVAFAWMPFFNSHDNFPTWLYWWLLRARNGCHSQLRQRSGEPLGNSNSHGASLTHGKELHSCYAIDQIELHTSDLSDSRLRNQGHCWCNSWHVLNRLWECHQQWQRCGHKPSVSSIFISTSTVEPICLIIFLAVGRFILLRMQLGAWQCHEAISQLGGV